VTPGLQPETLGETLMYVVPSSSGRTAAYPRQAKLAFYEKLRELIEALPATAEVSPPRLHEDTTEVRTPRLQDTTEVRTPRLQGNTAQVGTPQRPRDTVPT
jgi:hypothetical protein